MLIMEQLFEGYPLATSDRTFCAGCRHEVEPVAYSPMVEGGEP